MMGGSLQGTLASMQESVAGLDDGGPTENCHTV